MICAEIKEGLVDFLYDQLSPDMRAAFAQHLDGCPTCKAEMASFQKTLGKARAALRGPLSQEPPMRVRLAVLEAAQAAKPSLAQGESTGRSLRAKPANSDDDGFFTRLFRSPWFLPAFSAASVATVVFLVRVLKNPEVLPGQQPHAIEEISPQEPSPALAPAPADKALAAKAPAMPASADEQVKPERKAEKLRAGDSALPAAAGSGALGRLAAQGNTVLRKDSRRFAEPPPAVPPVVARKKKVDNDPLLGLSAEVASAPEVDSAPTASPGQPVAIPAASPAPAASNRAAMKPQANRGLALDDKETETEQDLADLTPPAPAKKLAERRREVAAEANAPAESDKADHAVVPALDDSIRKADRLFASQDWNAAADAYRDLIRRFPSH
jgi:hypothetical protein